MARGVLCQCQCQCQVRSRATDRFAALTPGRRRGRFRGSGSASFSYVLLHRSLQILKNVTGDLDANKACQVALKLHAKYIRKMALEEAWNQIWERQGIKFMAKGGLKGKASAGLTWANVGQEQPVDEAINRAESLLEKLKSLYAEMKARCCRALQRVMQHVRSFISSLKERKEEATRRCVDIGAATASKAKVLWSEAKAFGSTVGDKSKRVVEDCKEELEKLAHRFKTD